MVGDVIYDGNILVESDHGHLHSKTSDTQVQLQQSDTNFGLHDLSFASFFFLTGIQRMFNMCGSLGL